MQIPLRDEDKQGHISHQVLAETPHFAPQSLFGNIGVSELVNCRYGGAHWSVEPVFYFTQYVNHPVVRCLGALSRWCWRSKYGAGVRSNHDYTGDVEYG